MLLMPPIQLPHKMESDTRNKKVTQTDNTVDLKRVTSSVYLNLS